MFLLKCLLFLFALSYIDAQYYYRPGSQSCPHPRIMYGRARLRQRGNFAKFTCLFHYTLIGNKYATCRNGQWDVPLPVCVRSGCPQLEEVKNSVNMTTHNNSWVVFFCLPGYQLTGSPVVYCDGRKWNSTAPECVAPSEATKVATECDFEKPDMCGWKLDELHDFDWRRWNKKTPSSYLQTGPTYDHTYGKNGTGYYMYVESSGRLENETARLISPVYDVSIARNACFVFYYHMYGRNMGGLRVYQKPDKVSIGELLSAAVRQNYTLFDQWGDQGNEWYSSVSWLTDFDDDFQIVIEGIRGQSFLSDIAIDDVSIQHGENCTSAMDSAITPSSVLLDTCAGRCDLYNEFPSNRGCSCCIICVINQNCCPDFFDLCEFPASDRTDDGEVTTESSSSAARPQTDKLVASTTAPVPPPTPTSTKTSISIVNITRIITYPSTSTTSTTTSTTTTTTTTRRPTTRYLRSTTKPTVLTTKSSTTTKITPKTTIPTTTTTTTRKPTMKVVKPIVKTTTLRTAVTPVFPTTIFVVRKTTHDYINRTTGKGREKKQLKEAEAKSKGMSGAVVTTIVLLVVAICGAIWALLVLSRSARGLMLVGRLRAHATHDSEVHYLKSDVDE